MRGARARDGGETPLQRDIMKALGALDDVIVFRNAQTYREDVDDAGKIVRASRGGLGKGSADLICIVRVDGVNKTRHERTFEEIALGASVAEIVPIGRFAALEAKTPTGTSSPEQRAWAAAVRAMGGFACVVRSVDEALAAIERARKGATS